MPRKPQRTEIIGINSWKNSIWQNKSKQLVANPFRVSHELLLESG
jgi:hypothetical protein